MGWHWKQVRWNEYVLIGPAGEVKLFATYRDLHLHCTSNNIDATQV